LEAQDPRLSAGLILSELTAEIALFAAAG